MSIKCRRTILGSVENLVAAGSGRPVPPLDDIAVGSKFDSFQNFETKFNEWKSVNRHPFRVASSETLRMPDGTLNEKFKYRYIVYHCAHYGSPRMRGVGKRPNQNYMPCGCRAMLRLNYSWTENLLKITTLNHEHFGHDEEKIGPDLAKKPKIQVKNHPKSPKDENLPRNYANEAKNLHKNYANFSENSSSIGLADDFKSKNHPNQAKITPKNYANEANILPNLHSNYANLLQNRSSIGLIDKIQSKNYANVAKIAEILPKNYANELNILPNLHRNYANFPQIIDNLVSPTNTVLLLRQFLVKNNRSILSQPILEELRQSIINFPLNDDYADVEFQRALSDLKNLAAFYRSKKR